MSHHALLQLGLIAPALVLTVTWPSVVNVLGVLAALGIGIICGNAQNGWRRPLLYGLLAVVVGRELVSEFYLQPRNERDAEVRRVALELEVKALKVEHETLERAKLEAEAARIQDRIALAQCGGVVECREALIAYAERDWSAQADCEGKPFRMDTGLPAQSCPVEQGVLVTLPDGTRASVTPRLPSNSGYPQARGTLWVWQMKRSRGADLDYECGCQIRMPTFPGMSHS